MLHFAKWKAILTLATCLIAVAFALPNLLTREQADALPSWLPHRQINLGLDLQGGSHLLMEVDTATVVRERLEALMDSMRDELRKARIRYQDLGIVESAVTVRIPDTTQVEQAREILRKIDPDATLQETTDSQFRLALSEEAVRQRKSAAVEQSLEIVRRRIDETGVREPSIQRQGADRILVQLPGVDDPQRIKALIGKTAKMTFHLLDERADISESLAGRPPPGSIVLPLLDRHAPGQQRRVVVNRRVVVSGESLVDAQPTFQNGEPVVSFRFDTAGGRRFGEATSQNVGKQLAIVLDDQVISAPQIREPILGGSGVITGGFSVAEAQDLALLLRAGALPAPLKVLEERTVGPGLGSDSIRSGVLAGIVGSICVVAFMIIAYGTFGLIANLALVVNAIILVAAMSALQATLTLPGIAGIVLTIGMAVDANVLIFEHIREEVRTGRTPVAAIDSGFTRALTTIIDSNLTTLFAAGFLYLFGSGPVRGFAVTLGIGIIASMFTAVTLTRLIVVAWLRRYRPRALAI
jgi:preprotein translocase subunit SecD